MLVTLQSRVRTPRRGSGRARNASGMAPIEAHGFFRSRTRLLVYSQKLAPVELPFNTGGAEGPLRSPLTGLKEGCLGYGAPAPKQAIIAGPSAPHLVHTTQGECLPPEVPVFDPLAPLWLCL